MINVLEKKDIECLKGRKLNVLQKEESMRADNTRQETSEDSDMNNREEEVE